MVLAVIIGGMLVLAPACGDTGEPPTTTPTSEHDLPMLTPSMTLIPTAESFGEPAPKTPIDARDYDPEWWEGPLPTPPTPVTWEALTPPSVPSPILLSSTGPASEPIYLVEGKWLVEIATYGNGSCMSREADFRFCTGPTFIFDLSTVPRGEDTLNGSWSYIIPWASFWTYKEFIHVGYNLWHHRFHWYELPTRPPFWLPGQPDAFPPGEHVVVIEGKGTWTVRLTLQ